MDQSVSSGSSAGQVLFALVAPVGRLSGDGQLRELMQERRDHGSLDGPGIWYVPEVWSEAVFAAVGMEAVVVREARVATWLELRFGVASQPFQMADSWLGRHAAELPPAAPVQPLDRSGR